MHDGITEQKNKLVAEIKKVMGELDSLLRDSASDATAGVSGVQDRLRDRMYAARETLADLEFQVSDRARAAAHATDDYVRTHPWASIGAAISVGVLIGLVLNANRR